MNKNIDINEIKLYLSTFSDTDYFGQYKNGSSHYFRLNNNKKVWDIIPYGSSSWDSLDQYAWNGKEIDKVIDNTNDIPDWMPAIPTNEELEAVPSIKWEDNFKGDGVYSADSFPNLKKYFVDNKLKEAKLYFGLYEDVYESKLGDGIYRYLGKVSFDKDEINDYVKNLPQRTISSSSTYGYIGYFKEHTIMYDGQQFAMPDFKPLTFEHYKLENLMKIADEIHNKDLFRYFVKKSSKNEQYVITANNEVFFYAPNPKKANSKLWLKAKDVPELSKKDYLIYTISELKNHTTFDYGKALENQKMVERKYRVNKKVDELFFDNWDNRNFNFNEYNALMKKNDIEPEVIMAVINQCTWYNYGLIPLGDYFLSWGKIKWAKYAYKAGIFDGPSYSDGYDKLMEIYIEKAKFKKCDKLYQKAKSMGNKDYDFNYIYGVSLVKRGDTESAIMLFDTDIKKVFELFKNAEELYDKKKYYKLVYKIWTKATDLIPDSEILKSYKENFDIENPNYKYLEKL